MALRLYGVTDPQSGMEFMIRARSDALAVDTVDLLQSKLNASGTLLSTNFDGPFRLESGLVASEFDINGTVNGVST